MWKQFPRMTVLNTWLSGHPKHLVFIHKNTMDWTQIMTQLSTFKIIWNDKALIWSNDDYFEFVFQKLHQVLYLLHKSYIMIQNIRNACIWRFEVWDKEFDEFQSIQFWCEYMQIEILNIWQICNVWNTCRYK